jgi:ribosomal protein S18 acetylase RimI-like enzyme
MNEAISGQHQSECAIRPWAHTDVERIARLAGQLGYPSKADDVRRRIQEMDNAGTDAVFVAEADDGQICGWISVHVFRCVELDSFAEVSGLVVDEYARSRGVGKRLLDAAERWAGAVGSRQLSVRCNTVRERAHRFYEANGYEHIKLQKIFRKRLG